MLELHVRVPRVYTAVRVAGHYDGQRTVLGLEGRLAPGRLNAGAWEPFGLSVECPADSTPDVRWILAAE